MSTRAAKEIMYIYNENEDDTDLEFDADGIVPEPPSGTAVSRRGKQWHVSRTSMQTNESEPVAAPLLTIRLTDHF